MKNPKKIKIKFFKDYRGEFLKFLSFKQKKLILKNKLSEVNISINKNKGTIRGMHYQTKFKEKKLVLCLKGEIVDYCINVKSGKVHRFKLNDKCREFLVVPEGFAHGFQAIKNDTVLLYIHSNKYSPSNEKTINPFDPKYKLRWPIKKYIISKKDLYS